ncbi:ATP-grasp domain-containing protein [bacterium]|jgi:glutathione synthase/RimK-type ligase-like ATP-grasp enzyme|nr:ATP-grasp domain-containing protein [bacterium]
MPPIFNQSKDPIVAVIVAYYGGADILLECQSRGIPTVRIQLSGHEETNQYLKQYLASNQDTASYVVKQDENEPVESLAKKLKVLGITHIIPADEAGVELGDKLCDLLGLPFNGMDATSARRNKRLMHQKIAGEGVDVPRQGLVASAFEADIWMLKNKTSFPVVIKPLDGAGSAGVNKCENREGVKHAFEEIGSIATQKKQWLV